MTARLRSLHFRGHARRSAFTPPLVYEFPPIRAPALMTRRRRHRQGHRPAEVRAKLGNDPELAQKTKAAIPGSALIGFPDGERPPPKSGSRSGSKRRCQGVFRGHESSPEVSSTLGGPRPELAAPNKLFPKSEIVVRIPISEALELVISEAMFDCPLGKGARERCAQAWAVSIALGATGRIALRGHAYPAGRKSQRKCFKTIVSRKELAPLSQDFRWPKRGRSGGDPCRTRRFAWPAWRFRRPFSPPVPSGRIRDATGSRAFLTGKA